MAKYKLLLASAAYNKGLEKLDIKFRNNVSAFHLINTILVEYLDELYCKLERENKHKGEPLKWFRKQESDFELYLKEISKLIDADKYSFLVEDYGHLDEPIRTTCKLDKERLKYTAGKMLHVCAWLMSIAYYHI